MTDYYQVRRETTISLQEAELCGLSAMPTMRMKGLRRVMSGDTVIYVKHYM